MFSCENKILITGANGLVGSALINELQLLGYNNLVLHTRSLCDLTDFERTKVFFSEERPDVVFHCAASVYGILGNKTFRGSVFLDNILMNTHVVDCCRLFGVKKIIAMGTVAAYPEACISPIKETMIWDGPPHASEHSYAHAKRALLAQLIAYKESYDLDFAYVLSTNLYGPNDKFNADFGHVIPSLIYKFYQANEKGTDVCVWGSGSARRDFLHSSDMARALIGVMNQHSGPINVASGKDVSIREVVQVLSAYFKMENRVQWLLDKPEGRHFCPLELSLIQNLGFVPRLNIEEGLTNTLDWFLSTLLYK